MQPAAARSSDSVASAWRDSRSTLQRHDWRTGGTAPYTCLQTGGSLPAGLTLSASCVVSGTPTTAGTSPFTVKATDSGSPALTGTGPESITVAAAGSLTLTSPPNGTVGTPYSGCHWGSGWYCALQLRDCKRYVACGVGAGLRLASSPGYRQRRERRTYRHCHRLQQPDQDDHRTGQPHDSSQRADAQVIHASRSNRRRTLYRDHRRVRWNRTL